MKKILLGSAAAIAAVLVGCADSADYGQGTAAGSESASTNAVDPGVAPEPGLGAQPANDSPEKFNSLGSVSAPSGNVPVNVATNSSAAESNDVGGSEQSATHGNEQGVQVTPEPNTGDDQNPDNVKPE